MPVPLKNPIRQLYYRHGIITFLLFFAPLLPGFVEINTRLFLRLFALLQVDLKTVREAIGLVFGSRGLKIYRQHLVSHPEAIRAGQIFRAFYQYRDYPTGLKLIDKLFFDPAQRKLPLGDVMRATVIIEFPRLIHVLYPNHTDRIALLIHQLVSVYRIEQAEKSRAAIIGTAKILLNEHAAHARRRNNLLLDQQVDLLSAKIKAELAGVASAYTATFNHVKTRDGLPALLASNQPEQLIQILHHYSRSAAPRIATQAKYALLGL